MKVTLQDPSLQQGSQAAQKPSGAPKGDAASSACPHPCSLQLPRLPQPVQTRAVQCVFLVKLSWGQEECSLYSPVKPIKGGWMLMGTCPLVPYPKFNSACIYTRPRDSAVCSAHLVSLNSIMFCILYLIVHIVEPWNLKIHNNACFKNFTKFILLKKHIKKGRFPKILSLGSFCLGIKKRNTPWLVRPRMLLSRFTHL